jgi:hypothetical protein
MFLPTVTRPIAAVAQDWKRGRYPWQLLVAAVSWVVVAVSLIISRVGVPDASDAAVEGDSLSGTVPVVATNAQDNWFAPFLPWFGLLVLLITVALVLGYGWARIVLAACGLVAVVGLAMVAQWQVFPAIAGFVVGSVFGLLLPTHRYLQRPREDGPVAEPSSERTVTP